MEELVSIIYITFIDEVTYYEIMIYYEVKVMDLRNTFIDVVGIN